MVKGDSMSVLIKKVIVVLLLFFFLVALRFELGPWHLLGRCSTMSCPSPFKLFVIFQIGSWTFCPRQALDLHS
jgi:hypothetical protein